MCLWTIKVIRCKEYQRKLRPRTLFTKSWHPPPARDGLDSLSVMSSTESASSSDVS